MITEQKEFAESVFLNLLFRDYINKERKDE